MKNLNFEQRVIIDSHQMEWTSSPASGVLRKPLEREAKESGYSSSIVEYKEGASFSRHSHPWGEEIFVLNGVFSDENGNHKKGTYIRNPPGSSHTPFSQDGCVIFVKLNQFDPSDTRRVKINTNETPWLRGMGGLQVMPLHEFAHEHTALVKWPAGERFQPHRHWGGEEILVLSGRFEDEHGNYPKGTWIRSPHLSEHNPFVNEETVILVKTGHLPIPEE